MKAQDVDTYNMLHNGLRLWEHENATSEVVLHRSSAWVIFAVNMIYIRHVLKILWSVCLVTETSVKNKRFLPAREEAEKRLPSLMPWIMMNRLFFYA